MNIKVHFILNHKLRVLAYGKAHRNVSKTCRYFGISRESYYKWKREYEAKGEKALINRKPCPENPRIRVPQEVEDLILYLRSNYPLGQLRIAWYLSRYHGIKVSPAGVYSVLKRNGMNGFPITSMPVPCSPLSVMKSRCQAIGSRWMLSSCTSRIF